MGETPPRSVRLALTRMVAAAGAYGVWRLSAVEASGEEPRGQRQLHQAQRREEREHHVVSEEWHRDACHLQHRGEETECRQRPRHQAETEQGKVDDE